VGHPTSHGVSIVFGKRYPSSAPAVTRSKLCFTTPSPTELQIIKGLDQPRRRIETQFMTIGVVGMCWLDLRLGRFRDAAETRDRSVASPESRSSPYLRSVTHIATRLSPISHPTFHHRELLSRHKLMTMRICSGTRSRLPHSPKTPMIQCAWLGFIYASL